MILLFTRAIGSALVLIFLGCLVSAAQAAGPDFERAVVPILLSRCLECHQAGEPAGKLDLTSQAALLKGGRSGPAVVPGKPEESFLVERVEKGQMPPKKLGKPQPLPRDEQQTLREWIAAGAPWPEGRKLDPFEATTITRAGRDWWSLQPLRAAAVPRVKAVHQVANPIDSFLQAKLEERGWTFAPLADRRTLLRRVFIDLTGLPPTAQEVEAFERDPFPDAYERQVDRLLDSPAYGERWARHWLDVARFAETCGYERDQVKPFAWKYRDWVIRAFNEDKSYDRFVLEQLAGDELPDCDDPLPIATGFLRLGTWNDEPNDPQEYKYERLEDMVHATSTAFLGMTVKCARCHDHKFDPIRQTDYYRLAAAFWAGPIEPGRRDLLGGPDKELVTGQVLAWTDVRREPPPLHLLKKGEPRHPGPVVPPGHLSMVSALDQPIPPPPTQARTSQRRLALARWIVNPTNPLTPRVWVNRIWLHHFGQGLVRSPDNFGFTGDKPTHPELLDWLAAELVRGRWAGKRIHKLLLTSRAYRQGSLHPRQEEYARTDAGNHLWWHAERRRLDAESLRDATLAVSGGLNRALGGPSFLPEISREALQGWSTKDKTWKPSPASEQSRRSVYAFTRRGLLTPLMTTFDATDTTLPCGQRDVTIVAPQALALLNNSFIHQRSEALARRVVDGTSQNDLSGCVNRAWRLALSRPPSPSERTAALVHLETQARHFASEKDAPFLALASLCHALLNINEFIYID